MHPSSPSPTRILIVEDNFDDGELLLRQLDKVGLGSQVRIIEDGEDALTFLQSALNEIVAVFLDLQLPRLSGLGILRRVRADERFRTLPVIIMTSSNNPVEIEECSRHGVAGFVQKPVTYAAFSKAIADTFHQPSSLPKGATEVPPLDPVRLGEGGLAII